MVSLGACRYTGAVGLLAFFADRSPHFGCAGILAGKYDLDDPSSMPSFPKSLTMKKYLEGSAPLLSELS